MRRKVYVVQITECVFRESQTISTFPPDCSKNNFEFSNSYVCLIMYL